ncbi:hypothetical protein BYT27DRAFT_6488691 [Phlegmacium glaucopus]|nr:hypothetical protein BYT27DRAFT_6488691 [Phlegmacium glaucopus]
MFPQYLLFVCLCFLSVSSSISFFLQKHWQTLSTENASCPLNWSLCIQHPQTSPQKKMGAYFLYYKHLKNVRSRRNKRLRIFLFRIFFFLKIVLIIIYDSFSFFAGV